MEMAAVAPQVEAFTDKERLLRLKTPLPENTLLVESFSASEQISGLFELKLDLVADLANAANIDGEKLIGEPVTLAVSVSSDYAQGPWRYFNGIVSRFHKLSSVGASLAHYQAVVVPWLWLLTLDSKCRIYQSKTIPDIVKAVIDEYGEHYSTIVSFEERLNRQYTKLDYCVQYRESSFNFISRMLEAEGIFYFIEHSDGKHTVVLGDDPSVHKKCPEQPKGRLVGSGGWGEWDNPVLTWNEKQELRPGKYTLRDFHFQMPSKTLEVAETSTAPFNASKPLEIYDYPGTYAARFNDKQRDSEVQPEAEKLIRLRMEEQEAFISETTATSLCRAFAPGQKFQLDTGSGGGNSYIITAVQHKGIQTPWYLADEHAPAPPEPARNEEPYTNAFSCVPQNVVCRPRRGTPKPVVSGPQTAVVVGKAGEEIWTDEFGRVKVQFHWDREGKNDENSSCWVRVSQPWAGKNWGTVSIPRIGQEVIVDFLEGDPDQPIITGRVYNAEQTVPYKLPDSAVVSGIKSNSTKGGGGYNELSMNDTKGKENITIHAQYDMGTTVEHDDTQTVHHDRKITVDGTHNETVDKDTNITITTGPYKLDVKANTYTHHVNGAVKETYDATQNTTVDKDISITSQTAKITVTAKTEIVLQCGLSYFSMKQDGTILLSGENISISGNQQVMAGVASQTVTCDTAKVTVSAAGITSTAVGVHEISGALVKIN